MTATSWRLLAGIAALSWLADLIVGTGLPDHDADILVVVIVVALIGVDVAEIKERHKRALDRIAEHRR